MFIFKYCLIFYLLNISSIPLFLSINRCGIPKELTVLIGIAEKAGDMKATVEVTNGRGGPTVVRKKKQAL